MYLCKIFRYDIADLCVVMSVIWRFFEKPFLPDNCRTYDNPKNSILMSENIRQQRLTILEYFDAYIYHHYQPKITQ